MFAVVVLWCGVVGLFALLLVCAVCVVLLILFVVCGLFLCGLLIAYGRMRSVCIELCGCVLGCIALFHSCCFVVCGVVRWCVVVLYYFVLRCVVFCCIVFRVV